MKTGPVVHLNTNASWGGGETQILFLLRELKQRGIAARLFTHPDGRLLKVAREESLDAHPLPYTALGKSGRGSGTLCQMLRHHSPALLHAHDSISTHLSIRCAQRLKIPAIMTRRIASPIRNNWFSRRTYSPDRLAAIACISGTVKKALIHSSQYPASRIHLIRSACDAEHLDAVHPLTEFDDVRPAYRVGGVGKLSPKKNWGLMIRTAERLKNSGLDIHWYLTGTGPEEKRLRLLADKLHVAERVHFLGFREDAVAITRSMDAYFFPSTMEGAGVSVFEAMAMRIPVISADAPGTIETLDGSGWIVGRDDPDAAATAVTEALTDPGKREQSILQAEQIIRQQHSIGAMVDAYAKLYDTLTSDQARSSEVG